MNDMTSSTLTPKFRDMQDGMWNIKALGAVNVWVCVDVCRIAERDIHVHPGERGTPG
jgi:hypothetical protein